MSPLEILAPQTTTPYLRTSDAFALIHPLEDRAEQKCSSEGLGRIRLTPAVRSSLWALRIYLTGMALALGYHVLDLAGLVHHR